MRLAELALAGGFVAGQMCQLGTLDVLSGKGKILIFDEVLPERAEPAAAFSFMLDMEMLVVAPGGRERTEEEFRRLLAASGFRLNRVILTDFMRLGAVEGVLA